MANIGGWSNDNRDTIEWLGTIKSEGFQVGINLLGASEFFYLDGQDQSVLTTSTPQFADVDITGTSPFTCTDPTGVPTGAFSYGSGEYPDSGFFTHQIRAYAFKQVGTQRAYSTNYIQSAEITDDGSAVYNINWTLPALPSGATGWRILKKDNYNGYNFDYYTDATATFTDEAQFLEGSTVTPKTSYSGVSTFENKISAKGGIDIGINPLTTDAVADLVIYQNSGGGCSAGMRITGTGLDPAGSDGTGVLFACGYNQTSNKQFWIGDPDYCGDISGSFLRVITITGLSYFDFVKGDNSAVADGAIGSNILIGGGGVEYAPTTGYTLDVYNNLLVRGNAVTKKCFAVQLIAGEYCSGGIVVRASRLTDGYVLKTGLTDGIQGRDQPIGVVLSDAVSGAIVTVAVSGIVDVLNDGTANVTTGDFIQCSPTMSGAILASTIPPVPADANHWRECGHAISSRTGYGLFKAVIHFN